MQHRQVVQVRLRLLVLLLATIDQITSHELTSTTSCTITHFTKHSDSSCSSELAETASEDLQGFDVVDLNGMIQSGDCFHIDPKYSAEVKLRVECASASAIKLQYYNLFGDDDVCRMEESEAKVQHAHGSKWSTITAQDGTCTAVSDGVYYKFGIQPVAKHTQSERRQMTGTVIPAGTHAPQAVPQGSVVTRQHVNQHASPQVITTKHPNAVLNPSMVSNTHVNPAVVANTHVNPAVVTNSHVNPYVVPYQAAHHVNQPIHNAYNSPLNHPDYVHVQNNYPIVTGTKHNVHNVRTGLLDKAIDPRYRDSRLYPLARGAANAVGRVTDVGASVVGEAYDYVGDVASYAWQRRPRNILNAQPHQMSGDSKSDGLSTGAIIGIAGGGVVFLSLCVGSLCYFMKGNNKSQPFESQMGNLQQGPNFTTGEITEDESMPNNGETFNTTVTNGPPGTMNYQKQNQDVTSGSYL